MYLEDYDLCRRMKKKGKIIYYPSNYIIHEYQRGHKNNMRLLYYFISSTIKYFNKWGWFFDVNRKNINHSTLKSLNYNQMG